MTTDTDTTPTLNHTSTTLKRRVRQYTSRVASFLDFPTSYTIVEILYAAVHQQVDRVYLVGGMTADDAPPREWWLDAPGWEVSDYRQDADVRGATYTHLNEHGKVVARVEVHMSAQWFGPLKTADACTRSHKLLSGLLRGSFDSHANLMGTPARTGIDLWERSLPRGAEYPLLPEHIRDILYANSGQGRLEWVAQPGAPEHISGLWVYDAKWQYASCMRHLPVGASLHMRAGPDGGRQPVTPYMPAFYRVVFQVPPDWAHIGILAELYNGEDGKTHARWPQEPGSWHHAWVSGAELQVARYPFRDGCELCRIACKAQAPGCPVHGWDLRVKEGIFWPDTQASGVPGTDPARTFIETLRALRERCPDEGVRYAIRAMQIGAVGSCHRRDRDRLVSVPVMGGELPPVPARAHEVKVYPSLKAPEREQWLEPAPLHPDQLRWQRPEWSATVWGRARARTARFALSLPPEWIVAIRSDAVVLSSRLEDEEMDPQRAPAVGEFRLKHARRFYGPEERPRGQAAYFRLLGGEDGD